MPWLYHCPAWRVFSSEPNNPYIDCWYSDYSPGLLCNYRWIALSLSLWLLCGGPQYFLSAHISLKSWTQKGLNCEAGWSVVQCAAPPDYGAFWSSLRQTVWLTESWPIFIAERLNIPFSASPTTRVSEGKRERVWVSWMACYCVNPYWIGIWHMELMPLILIGCFSDVLHVCYAVKVHECSLLCCNMYIWKAFFIAASIRHSLSLASFCPSSLSVHIHRMRLKDVG